MSGTPASSAVSNPEKLAEDDLDYLSDVVCSGDVRALNDGTTHEPFGSPDGPGLWHHKGKQLPAYIQQIAQALVRDHGTEESRAIATAVSRCKVWCATGKGDTKAKACAAVAEWEADKAETKASAAFRMTIKSAAATPAAPHTIPALVNMPGVDLLAAGTWELSSGRNTFTRDDIANAIEAQQCPAVGPPVIKLGHVDPRFDGEPAIGRVLNMRASDDGSKLVGDLTDMPGWLGAVAHAAYPKRSVEGSYNFKCQIGHTHPFVLTGLALLGVTSPGVGVLNALPDIASLYGVNAAAEWRTAPIETEGDVVAVTEEDVRRAYYANSGAPASWWITELQMAPTQLVVADDGGKIYRVPFQIEGDNGTISFGTAVPLDSYGDLAASRGTGNVVTYATAAESRAVEGSELSESPELTFIDPDVDATANNGWVQRDGEWVYDPDNDGDNDATAKGDTDHSHWGADGKLKPGMTIPAKPAAAAAADPPTMTGDDKSGDMNNAAMTHGAYTGTHSHPHAANGAQGGDDTHSHSHTHSGDANHGHTHTAAATGNSKEGSDMEFSQEQEANLRKTLGLAEGEELTVERVLTASATLREEADKKIAAARRTVPNGVVQIEQEVFDNMKQDIAASVKFRERVERNERDEVIDAAIAKGKFSAARRAHWQRAWDGDPEGTRNDIANLSPNLVPVRDVGASGGSLEEDMDREFESLWAPGTFKRGR